MNISGIKQSKACQIAAVFEIARRLEAFSEDAKPQDQFSGGCVQTPVSVYEGVKKGNLH
ncbi:MAG TPA: hypothetical protein VN316_00840 [candidate division Zixibacteria bacterium]|nr:hypothetical protein [candidate division Zixibacteria bacterium]